MKCANCHIDKLSKEFPVDTIGKKCCHIPSFCLKCLINYFDAQKSNQKCPECETVISKQEVKDLNLAWEEALFRVNFMRYNNNLNSNQNGEINTAKGDIYVILLNGTKLNFKLEEIKSVEDLKEAIEKQTKVRISKQKLTYKGVELQTISSQGTKNLLSDYSIVPESHIQLMVLLYSISKELSINDLTFDLFWGYPSGGRDFLDGTCMLYTEAGQLYRTFDWSKKIFDDIPNVSHSGDIMDNVNKRGHHCIKAKLSLMPSNVTRLYFILSAYNSPNIGCFPNPSFKLYDPSDPDIQLCSYTIQSAATSQAVIMCVVEKNEKDDKGGWNIFEIGRLSDGNAKFYQPIINTINTINAIGDF